MVEFNKLAAHIDWNEPALWDCFYHGLPLHLRTEVLKGGKPLTLATMHRKAQECDQIHWMTWDEITREPKSTPRPAAKDSDAKPFTSSSTASKPSNTPRPSRPGNPAPSSAPSSSAPKPKPNLSNKLGKDSKLNSNKCKCQMDNNLCLYCGTGGHTAKDCRKASTAHGHTANASASTENSAHAVGCIDPSCAPMEIHLNASTLSASDSLVISLSCPLVLTSLTTLVDSGSSHCFIDNKLVDHFHLPTSAISLILLCLLDGSCNSIISRTVEMPVTFSSGETLSLMFFATPLDSGCPLVLGYSWLTRYNPLIDWVSGNIIFHSMEPARGLAPPNMSSPLISAPLTSVLPDPAHQLPLPVPSAPPQPLPDTPKPKISLISAAAFACACKLPGSSSFSLSLASLQGRSGTVSDAPDLSGIPAEYHNYANVFSKAKAQTLAPHRPYDLKIELEEGAAPPPTCIYSVSESELQAL
ncbi:hypothetical protein AX17_005552 [Amanita inopinata Kibby_2008]|nr:hypothetical protein AX17_005552 [Amanita inopinata Kibby_2008]